MTDRASGYSKGYRFVRYTNLQDAEQGLKSPIATNLSYSNEMPYIFNLSIHFIMALFKIPFLERTDTLCIDMKWNILSFE